MGEPRIPTPAAGQPQNPLPNNQLVGTTPGGSNNASGVLGQSNFGPGVTGQSLGTWSPNVVGTAADGVLGEGRNGVHGRGADSGVWGENTGSGVGVSGTSNGGDGIHGTGGRNGVVGRTSSVSDSGLWGENTGSGVGVAGTSNGGDGIHGTGARNGVVGRTSSGTDSGVWADNTGAGAGVAGTSAGGIGVYGRGGTFAGHFDGDVEVTGDIRVHGDVTLINEDCAEDFEISCSDEIEPGTVMVITTDGALQVSQSAYDNHVAGVVSGAGNLKPGIILGRNHIRGKRLPIALLGKVYCKIDAGYAAIEVGDLLTSSPTPGHAMKAENRVKAFGAVLGKALAPLKTGKSMIPILVTLQ